MKKKEDILNKYKTLQLSFRRNRLQNLSIYQILIPPDFSIINKWLNLLLLPPGRILTLTYYSNSH